MEIILISLLVASLLFSIYLFVKFRNTKKELQTLKTENSILNQQISNFDPSDDQNSGGSTVSNSSNQLKRPENTAINYGEVADYLEEFDKTRLDHMEHILGYEDSRMVTFDFNSLQLYLNYVYSLSIEIEKEISGITFIDVAKSNYRNSGKSYKSLIYIPTTIIDGKHVQFDPHLSKEEGKIVTFAEALKRFDYEWMYGEKYNYQARKLARKNEKQAILNSSSMQARRGGKSTTGSAGNFGHMSPPN